ncbi:MAG: S-layer homology domain-containing protein [Clostridia bacterium]|nr:S-layer homology domain-containing protein [Clostridia bacterium]
MNKQKITAVLAAVLTVFLSASVFAGAKVSPGLDVIAGNITMRKTCEALGAVCIGAKDIDNACGVERVDMITVTSLPEGTCGRLTLAGEPVSKDQIITRQSFRDIEFSSYSADDSETSFGFTAQYNGGSTGVDCIIYTLSGENSAPAAISGRYWSDTIRTYENVPIYSTLPSSDPDGDEVEFRIVSYPVNGVIKLTNAAVGNFRYTPNENYTGGDSFEYSVTDKYGNSSKVEKISIIVEKRVKTAAFEDMKGHWAQYASLRLTDAGIMPYYETDGKYYFEPSSGMTRAQFVSSAMKTFGFAPVAGGEGLFADFGDIPRGSAGYVTAAASSGIVSGSVNDDGEAVFRPNDFITRAEASAVICNLIGTEEVSVTPVFDDMTEAPLWSENAIYTMQKLGIIHGTGDGRVSPEKILTRAEAAQILVKFE